MSVTMCLNYVSQHNNAYGIFTLNQDRYATGRMFDRIYIASDGLVTEVFSNGQELTPCQLIVANVANPVGLTMVGTDVYFPTTDSDAACPKGKDRDR